MVNGKLATHVHAILFSHASLLRRTRLGGGFKLIVLLRVRAS